MQTDKTKMEKAFYWKRIFWSICLIILFAVEVTCSGYQFRFTTREELAVGSEVGRVKETFLREVHRTKEAAITDAHLLRFYLRSSSSNHNNFFHLDNTSGILTNNQIFDREVLCRPGGSIPSCVFHVDILVTPRENVAILKITIELLDENDNYPKFPTREFRLEISDQARVGNLFSLPVAEDADGDDYGVQRYFIQENESDQLFLSTFNLVTQKMLDGSLDLRLVVKKKLHVDKALPRSVQGKIVVIDKGKPPLSDDLLVVVNTIKTSENEPRFESLFYQASVAENVDEGTWVLQVKATMMNDSFLQYHIQHSLSPFTRLPFKINSKTGSIYVNSSIDFESEKKFTFTVVASSFTRPSSSSSTVVDISVIDLNDCAPEVSITTLTQNNKAQIRENSPEGTFISYLRVVDRDEGLNGKVSCHAQSSYFSLIAMENLNSHEYKLVSAAVFDREEVSKHEVKIVCEDFGNPSLSSGVMLEVHVSDENDNAPFFARNSFIVELEENTPHGAAFLSRLHASDIDEGQNAVLTYYLHPLEGDLNTSLLHVDELDGGIYSHHSFDYEKDKEQRFFLATAVDSGETKLTGTTTLVLNIIDLNDNPPRFTQASYNFHSTRNECFEGSGVGLVNAMDDDKSLVNSRITYTIDGSLEGSYFNIDPFTGELSWTKIPSNRTTFNFTVTASNAFAKHSLSTLVPVHVQLDGASKISISTSAKSEIHVFTGPIHEGVPIFQVRVKHDHLIKPRFQIVSGNEKGEFHIDATTGIISATMATEHGLFFYNFTIIISDRGQNFDQTVLHLPIFVNNTHHHQPSLEAWTENPENILIVVCVAVATLSVLVLAIVLVVLRRKCKKNTKRSFAEPKLMNEEVGSGVKVVPNLYESDSVSKISSKAESDRRKEVKFSLVQLGEDERGKGSLYYHNVDGLFKNNSESPYDPWVSCNKKPRETTHEEEASLTDSGKGTSDEGDATSSHLSKLKDSRLTEAIGLDNFNQSIISREKRLSNLNTRFNSTCLIKPDNLLPMTPLGLSLHMPVFSSLSGEDCELCLMDQRRINRQEKANLSVASITTTV